MKKLVFKSNKPFIQSDTGTKILSQTHYDVQRVHINHTHENYEDFKDEIYNTYVVFESYSNYPICHLISASHKDEALQGVYDFIQESGTTNGEDILLLHVEQINTNN